MQYDELITACIEAIDNFDPKIETEGSFIAKFINKVILKIYNYLHIVNKRNK